MKNDVKESLRDYAVKGEQTDAHRGPLNQMEDLWNGILQDMQQEAESSSTINANLELFNEVYKNEFMKLKVDFETAENDDLYALRFPQGAWWMNYFLQKGRCR